MMGYVPILAIIVCLVLCTPAVHAEGPPPAPPPVPPQPEDPVCWRVSPECTTRSLRWGEGRDTRLYLDVTNICKDTLYIYACLELLNNTSGDENTTCLQLFLAPGATESLEAFRIEEPTERHSIKTFGVKDKNIFQRKGAYNKCISLVPGFFDARF